MVYVSHGKILKDAFSSLQCTCTCAQVPHFKELSTLIPNNIISTKTTGCNSDYYFELRLNPKHAKPSCHANGPGKNMLLVRCAAGVVSVVSVSEQIDNTANQ